MESLHPLSRHETPLTDFKKMLNVRLLEITKRHPVLSPASIILISIAYVKPGLTICLIFRNVS